MGSPIGFPVRASQSRAVASALPVSTVVPSGLYAVRLPPPDGTNGRAPDSIKSPKSRSSSYAANRSRLSWRTPLPRRRSPRASCRGLVRRRRARTPHGSNTRPNSFSPSQTSTFRRPNGRPSRPPIEQVGRGRSLRSWHRVNDHCRDGRNDRDLSKSPAATVNSVATHGFRRHHASHAPNDPRVALGSAGRRGTVAVLRPTRAPWHSAADRLLQALQHDRFQIARNAGVINRPARAVPSPEPGATCRRCPPPETVGDP